jgi:mannose-6-phosphate isomerase-like protein (cupin superfamily)
VIRRVVTGHDARGRAVVSSDAPAPSVHTNPKRPGYRSTEIWRTEGAPALVGNDADPTGGPRRQMPPPRGTVIRINEFAPEPEALRNLSAAARREMFAELGIATPTEGRHPTMHRTETVDYAIVLSGEIWLVLDDDDVLLREGDVVVQRGTSHAWSNRSDKPCRIAFVLIDGRFDPAIAGLLK